MGFRRSVPWASQPQGAVGISKLALDLGLQAALIPAPGGWFDCIGGKLLTPATSTSARASIAGIESASAVGSASGVSLGRAINIGTTGQLTVLTVATVNDTRIGSQSFLYDGDSASGSGRFLIYRRGFGTAGDTYGLYAGGSSIQEGDAGLIALFPNGIQRTVTAVHNGSAHAIYVDAGALLQSWSVAVTYGDFTPHIAGQWDGATGVGWGGGIALQCYFNKALTADQIAVVHRNPWQLFAPMPRSLGGITGTVTPTLKPFRRSVPWTSQPQVSPALNAAFPQPLVAFNGATGRAIEGAIASTVSGAPQGSVVTSAGIASVFTSNNVTFPNTGQAFPNGFSWLLVGRYNSASGVQASFARGWAGSTGGFEFSLYNSFGSPGNRIWAFTGGACWINGVQDTTNPSSASTTAGAMYAIAGRSPAFSAATDNIGLNFTTNGPLIGATDTLLLIIWPNPLPDALLRDLSLNPSLAFAPQRRSLGGISGTISRPGTDVSVAGWSFTAASLAGSINEATRDDASYAQAAYGVAGAITTLDLPLVAGSYTLRFAGNYLTGVAASGQFRFTALDGSNTVLGTSAWQAVTSSVVQYDVPITITGTATRIQIEIQA